MNSPRTPNHLTDPPEEDGWDGDDGIAAEASDEANHRDHQGQLKATGFWGRQAAGCLFMAQDTGRLLIAHRSARVEEPHTWGTWGGAMDRSETPAHAVRREVAEETGHDGPSTLVPLAVFSHESGFRYHNFLMIVPEEFEPVLNWESQDHRWVDLHEMPEPQHPGLSYLLQQSGADLARLSGACKAARHAVSPAPSKLAVDGLR